MPRYRLLFITTAVTTLLWTSPLKAQLQFREIVKNTSQSRLVFAPYTVGAVIVGGGDRLYVVKAQKNQYLRVIVNSTGARAFVAVFDGNGKQLAVLTDRSKPFEYKLPKTGNYYVFCYSGPSVHLYDLTVRVD